MTPVMIPNQGANGIGMGAPFGGMGGMGGMGGIGQALQGIMGGDDDCCEEIEKQTDILKDIRRCVCKIAGLGFSPSLPKTPTPTKPFVPPATPPATPPAWHPPLAPPATPPTGIAPDGPPPNWQAPPPEGKITPAMPDVMEDAKLPHGLPRPEPKIPG